MSYNSTLQTNNDLIQALIEKANTLPDAGSDGSTIGTCTIELTSFNEILALTYTAFENGACVAKYINPNATSCVLNNVVCGSVITFCNGYSFNGITGTGIGLVRTYKHHMALFSAPTEADATAEVIIYDND